MYFQSKCQQGVSLETDKLILKCIWRGKEPRIPKTLASGGGSGAKGGWGLSNQISDSL